MAEKKTWRMAASNFAINQPDLTNDTLNLFLEFLPAIAPGMLSLS
jgi:hypothetical protein